jgi:ABC-type transport system involved in multi-copper enzyme maturation permease subunit
VNPVASPPTRWSVAGVIAWREAKAALRGWAGYLALSAATLAAAWMLLLEVRALRAAGILVRSEIFQAPLAASLLVLALFLAVWASASAARDRESGTLEVLFFAPVDELAYVSGKVGGLLIAYTALLPILLACLLLLALITGFSITPGVVASLVLSFIPAAGIVSIGVLLSVGTQGVRSALLLLIGVVFLMFAVSIGYRLVLLIPIEDPASPVLPLRDALAAANAVVQWVSPFAYLERIVAGVTSGAWRTALVSLLVAILYTAAAIGLAAVWLRRRTVLRRDE